MTEESNIIQLCREAVSTCIVNSADPSTAIGQLVSVGVPQNNKFVHLDFSKIVADNGQSIDTLKRLSGGLNILEKYGRHLLKPSGSRSNMWRHIKFSNSIFRDRVDTVKGGRDIMYKMGYSELRSDGVAFPDSAEPNHDEVLSLVTDLVLFKKELEMYMLGTHPHPQSIDQCLPVHVVTAIRQPSDGPKDASASPSSSMILGSNATSRQISPKPSLKQEVPSPATRGAIPKKLPAVPVIPSEVESQLPDPCPVTTPSDHQVPSIRCDICGENNADFVCQQCDNKQLCQGCNVKWHKHPKRVSHTYEKLRPDVTDRNITSPQPQLTQQDQYQRQLWQLQQQQQQQHMEQQYIQQQQQHQQQLEMLRQQQLRQHETYPQPHPDMRGSHGNRDPVSMYPIPASSPNFIPNLSLPPEHLLRQSSNSAAKVQPQHPYSYGYQQFNPAQSSNHPAPGTHPTLPVPQPWSSQANMPHHMPGTIARENQYATMLPTSSHQNNMFATNIGTLHAHEGQYATMHQLQGTSQGRESMYTHLNQVPTSLAENIYNNNMHLLPGQVIPAQNVRQSINPAQDRLGHHYHGAYTNDHDLITTPAQVSGVMSPSTPSTGSATSGQVSYPPKSVNSRQDVRESEERSSELLPDIKTIKDVEKRLSRLKVDLMTLQGDIEEWNVQIDQIIRDNPDFFHDQLYISLNRRKRHHLKEIDELKKYKKELEAEIEEVHEMKASGQMNISKHLEEAEALKMRFKEVKNKAAADSPANKPSYPPPFKSFLPEADQHDPGISSRKDLQQDLPMPSQPFLDDCERLRVNSIKEDDLCEAMRQGVNITQPSSAGEGNQSVFNIPVDPPIMTEASPPQDLSPYVLPKPAADKNRNHMKHGISEPNIVNKSNVAPAISKASQNKSASDLRSWGCEHCTFINQPEDKVCVCCARTSDNPIYEDVVGPNVQCRFCTFENKQGSTVCEMCSKELLLPEESGEYMMMTGETTVDDTEQGAKQEEILMAAPGPVVPEVKARALDNIICQDQDKIYWEKKEAQKRFEEAEKLGYEITPAPSKSPKSHDLVQSSASPSKLPITEPAKSSLEQLKAEDRKMKMPQAPIAPKAEVKPFRPELNFQNAIQEINIKREREQMSIDGHQMVKLIKEAEFAGFDIDEVEIAIVQAVVDNMPPVDWLKIKWQARVDMVTKQTEEIGQRASQNSVGDITAEEARAALVEKSGDAQQATEQCVRERTEKYKKISEMGDFAREEILTALFQNKGDTEESLNQLHQSKLQPYVDRIWTQSNRPDRESEVAAAEAAANAEPNNSVVNSAVIHEEFQAVIKDVAVDKERRIRMVLVEGKLQSWGRAETVITLLDKELPKVELECSLADIIEAVKNCGDRKSSLFYLNQECEICYGRFPMSKICNLGSCNCKLCQGCVKQNFEYAVREKFVRNWGCPICQLPVLEEDETAAASYFEFLSLLLQQFVPQDVFELFEIRLRDWHLQKDPNFRWCAHCAFGFLYDRPDDPSMACPSCRKKTCFNCKKPWEDQHEGRTCEEFTQFKIDNDPERQAKGIQLYLEENGIDCPSCKMRYSLAKGGCLHFKCPQCGHEFCSACSQPFMQSGICKQLKVCARSGLHCHHPRDCFYYLRDNSVEDLQKLLKNKKKVFNTDAPPSQDDKNHCPVMEQKEIGVDKKDEPCGNDTGKGLAGLCMMHYKEYLVGLINKNGLDPVYILSIQDMKILIERRYVMQLPKLGQNENEVQYKRRLQQFVIENIKLKRLQHR